MNSTPIDSTLLTKVIAGEADDRERAVVEQWLAEAPENATELARMQRLWDLGAETTELPDLDLDAAFEKLGARIEAAEQGRRVIPIRFAPAVLRWVAAAAVLTGLVFAIRWFMQPGPERYVADVHHLTTTLKDSSVVTLSPGSRMEVRITDARRVKLKGEAYFEVQRDEQSPFTVEAGDVLVTVLGTAFEVSGYDTSSTILVRVRSGRVQVASGGDTLVLGGGEHARIDKARHFMERMPAPPVEVWGLRILHFEGATLHQVADQLQRLYQVRIDLRNEAIGTCTLTADFENEAIGVILQVIAETFALDLEQVDDAYYALDGEGC